MKNPGWQGHKIEGDVAVTDFTKYMYVSSQKDIQWILNWFNEI